MAWYCSFGTDFNYDFGVTIDESVTPGEYNFRTKAEFEAVGSDFFESAVRDAGPHYCFLDLTALDRLEKWEMRAGRSESARSATPDFAS